MTTPSRPHARKGMRGRMVASILGLAALPLLLALAALYFVIQDDVGSAHGRRLAGETEQLAQRMRAELDQRGMKVPQRRPDPLSGATLPGNGQPESAAILQKILEPLAKKETGSVVLFSPVGGYLAGSAGTPIPPVPEDGSGWVSFEAKGEGYFAGVAAVVPQGSSAQRESFVAIVQPASEVFRHFYSVSRDAALLLAVCCVLAVVVAWQMAGRFLRPILEIRRGAEIISHVNLSHRIELHTGDELEDLGDELNQMAGNLSNAYEELEARVRQATRTLQEERNRLATVLRTMVDGVVVANADAEVILLNPRARIILDRGYTSGIGKPLSRIFPGDRLDFHLKRLRRSWEQGRESVEDVIFPLLDGKLLKGTLSVIPGPEGELPGFLLVFRDLGAPLEAGDLFGTVLLDMPRLFRGSVATSSSLVETLQRHRDMPAEKQQAFLAAMAQEMDRLSQRVTAMEEAAVAVQTSRWPVIPSNPRELLEESLASNPAGSVEIESDDNIPLVQVEPFSWVASLRCVLKWIELRGSGRVGITANLRMEDGAVVTTFRIKGPFGGDPSELESLEVCPTGEAPLTLGETVRRNRGELWTRSFGEDCHEVRLGLLQTSAGVEGRSSDGLIEGEPEFYDFDLFLPRPVFEREELLQTPLPDLDYVVFDTETTGLQLSQGDKVVSLSAVRIRRGKVQNSDLFHTLVNPGRPIPPESVLIHHIEDHMVADAPSMNEVYPLFVEFAGDAVLVAHNAAFDKKALDMAAAEAGLPQLDNPILDTLFLSYGIHQGTEGHSLDAMAERMGITIEGRHTSLGDARATAQAFLGLLSLLPGRGVTTLADAKGFCDRHLLLRWQSSRY